MDVVLDTHVFLWWDMKHPALSRNTLDLLADPANTVFVSAASIWEIAIKRNIGKLTFVGSPARAIAANGFEALPISAEDAETAGELDWPHRDPFDRMLVGQCLNRRLTLVTADSVLLAHEGISRLKA